MLGYFASAQSQPQFNLMPMPANVQPGSGQLLITPTFSVAITGTHDPSIDCGAKRLIAQLSEQTGIPFRPKAGAAPTLTIHADHGREAVQKLGENESYELKSANLVHS